MLLFNKHILFLSILLCCACSIHAQRTNKAKKFFQNQIELGFNYAEYFGDRGNFWGYGTLFNDFKLTNFRINNFRSYKMIFNEKHVVKLGYFKSDILPHKPVSPNNLIIITNEIYTLGYSYVINQKYINVALGADICHRSGGEFVALNNPYDFDIFSGLDYNSFGFDLGVDLDYFFTKNFGIGANIAYYNFAFEDARLPNEVSNTQPDFARTYRPVNHFMNINFKLAYKFSFPSFKKK